jgi:hypothetical protein
METISRICLAERDRACAVFVPATGSARASQGDVQGARKLGRASMAFIIVGLIVGCAAWGVVLWWLVVDLASCSWSIYGVCYNYRNCYLSSNDCRRYFYDYYFLNGCCYYNY